MNNKETLQSLNTRLSANNLSLDDILTAVNELPDAGVGLKVFAQEEEPETKEGLWLQTSEKYDSVSLSPIPYETIVNSRPQLQFDFANGSGAVVGTYVYLFGGDASSNSPQLAYKYNLADDTYAQMSNMPFTHNYNPSIVIGTDIYIAGAWNTKTFYKFDTTTETYTQLANAPAILSGACFVQVGDYIYQIGGEKLGTKMYKYSISNNTWTLLSVTLPHPYNGSSVFAIDTDIYLVSTNCYTSSTGYYPPPNNYVFDTVTETFRTLDSVTPEGFVVVKTSVKDNFAYLVGGGGSDEPRMFKYYPDTDTYVKCGYLPGGYAATPVCYGNEFMSFGGYDKKRNLFSVTIPEVEPVVDGKTVIVDTIENPMSTNVGFKLMDVPATLLNYDGNFFKYFADVLYKIGEEYIDVPTYYGDGTQWIKIKN